LHAGMQEHALLKNMSCALMPQTTHAVTAVVAAFVSQFPQQPLAAAVHALSYFG